MTPRVALLISLSGAIALFAAEAKAVGWDSANRKVKSVMVQAVNGDTTGSYVHVGLDSVQNPDGCANGGLVRIDGSTALGKYLLSQMLIAQSTSQLVSVYFNGCDDLGYPLISGLVLITP